MSSLTISLAIVVLVRKLRTPHAAAAAEAGCIPPAMPPTQTSATLSLDERTG